MTSRAAREFAQRVHDGASDRYGVPLLEHVRRVAAAVPSEARTVAWLHEMLECSAISPDELLGAGASAEELAAVELLTRDPESDDDAYLAHVERIAMASGHSGHVARIVKRADLEDRLRQQHDQGPRSAGARPPYREALMRLETATAVIG